MKIVHLFGHFLFPGLDFSARHLLPGLVPRNALCASTPSGMKVWVTLPGKEPGPAEVFAIGKGNVDWIMEEGSHEYLLRPRDQLRKQGL